MKIECSVEELKELIEREVNTVKLSYDELPPHTSPLFKVKQNQ